jgi:hypothetical protein
MSRISTPHRAPGTTATAAELNEIYTELKENSDGTAGSVDTDNTRAGAVTTQHLAVNAVHTSFSRLSTGSTTTGTTHSSGINGAATAWTDIGTLAITGTPALAAGDVIRYHFNQLIGATVTNNTNAQQLYYLRVILQYNDGGGAVDLVTSPIYGYGLASRSANFSGSNGENTSAWTRNPIAGIIVNRTASRQYLSLRLQILMNQNDNLANANTVETCHLSAVAIVERL